MSALPLAAKYAEPLASNIAISWRLYADARAIYGKFASSAIDGFTLREIWVLVRDVVVALDRWGESHGGVSGDLKRRIALEALWWFLRDHGGPAALSRLCRLALGRTLPGCIARPIAWLVRYEPIARGLIRLVMEFAVAEARELATRQQ